MLELALVVTFIEEVFSGTYIIDQYVGNRY